MDGYQHLEAVFSRMIRCGNERRPAEKDLRTRLISVVEEVVSPEDAERIADVLDGELDLWEREVSGDADTLAESPGQSGGAI